MRIKKHLIPLLVLVAALAAGALSVSAQDWVKLGEKDVDFKIDKDSIDADHKGRIREIHLRVMNAPVKFKRVVINYKDGKTQELEYLEDVQIGTHSRSITIEGDGTAIKRIDLWYETDSLGGKKAKVSVYGRT